MRKHQQKQILELLNTIQEAQSQGLYADCQDAAGGLIAYIESIAGAGTQAAALLAEHEKLLFRAHNGEVGEKVLRRHLIKIENCVRHDLKPDKTEMIFIPYKASMWDSLESIYLAAKDDPDCDAYVIPIPYFEKNPDGTFGDMKYEVAKYPDYVPITHWQSYDIAEQRPDAIFTHAPYDNGNIVTSVHPDFYCKRLKDFTDMLVYVPYFVNADADNINESFIVNAGTAYADKVIVESEAVRQTYIRTIREYEKANNMRGVFGNYAEKILALGSPKIDKVLSTKREDCPLPEEWARLTKSWQGSGKQVLLYNTSVSGLLYWNEEYLKKIQQVLDKYKDDEYFRLWWRPHPLFMSTLASMCPELLPEYEQVVKEYREQGYGIYDDTPDLHRAIAWSDAYYGDISSLVPLYAVTGKPLMIQQVDVSPEHSRNDALMFECSYDDGEYVWFAAYFHNALYKMDKRTWVAEYVGAFPGEEKYQQKLFADVTECDGKLYFAPCSAEKIATYDMETGAFGSIKLEEHHKANHPSYDKYCKFSTIARCGRFVYFLPATYPAIIRIDCDSGDMIYMTDWLGPLSEIKNEDTWYFYGADVVNDKVYASVRCADAILVIDGFCCELKPIGIGGVNYGGICHDGNDFWLVPCMPVEGWPSLVKWNEGTGWRTVVYLSTMDDYVAIEVSNSSAIVLGILFHGGQIWIFPNRLKRSLKINVTSGDISDAEVFQTECGIVTDPTIYMTYAKYWEKDGVLYTLGARSGAITKYDTMSGESCVKMMTEDFHIRMSQDLQLVNLEKAGDCIYKMMVMTVI